MPRVDHSKYLVHWTKGESYEEAFDILRSIVFQGQIIAGDGNIRGGWRCVCFTESPEYAFHQVEGKYKPFGIQVPKSWLFNLGGRPVIYQASSEYDLLHESQKWRHVRYEPDTEPPVDFSWEREWRIRTDFVNLDPEKARIIIPDDSWAECLKDEHEYHEHGKVQLMASAYGEEWLAYPIDEFEFKFTTISV